MVNLFDQGRKWKRLPFRVHNHGHGHLDVLVAYGIVNGRHVLRVRYDATVEREQYLRYRRSILHGRQCEGGILEGWKRTMNYLVNAHSNSPHPCPLDPTSASGQRATVE